jgi:hypothetical protein
MANIQKRDGKPPLIDWPNDYESIFWDATPADIWQELPALPEVWP